MPIKFQKPKFVQHDDILLSLRNSIHSSHLLESNKYESRIKQRKKPTNLTSRKSVTKLDELSLSNKLPEISARIPRQIKLTSSSLSGQKSVQELLPRKKTVSKSIDFSKRRIFKANNAVSLARHS